MKDSGFGAGWYAGSKLIGVLSGLALGAMFGMWFGLDVISVPEACEGSAGWRFSIFLIIIIQTFDLGVGVFF